MSLRILSGLCCGFVAGLIDLILPCSFIIGWKEPASLIPIIIMTTVLGGLLGFVLQWMIRWFIRKGLISA